MLPPARTHAQTHERIDGRESRKHNAAAGNRMGGGGVQLAKIGREPRATIAPGDRQHRPAVGRQNHHGQRVGDHPRRLVKVSRHLRHEFRHVPAPRLVVELHQVSQEVRDADIFHDAGFCNISAFHWRAGVTKSHARVCPWRAICLLSRRAAATLGRSSVVFGGNYLLHETDYGMTGFNECRCANSDVVTRRRR